MLAQEVDLDALLALIGSRVATALRAERATVFLVDGSTGELRSRVADLPELPELRLPPGTGLAGFVADTGEVVNVRDTTADPRYFSGVDRQTGFHTRTILAAPVRDHQRATRAVLEVLNKVDGAFSQEDEAFLQALAGQVAQALERTTLRPSPDSARGVNVRGVFNHIVGASGPMKRVYELVSRAAARDVTVLLGGETGTGKGLIARAIHANGARRDAPFITVDCTTLPEALVESELFGHERGAYTGADRRVSGKVELAHGGTLFLDEVAELSLRTQARLLRFLQDRVYERVGGRATLRADARVLAATHRDLASQVEKGHFREDLYYRLRVVELRLPSLRERGGAEVEGLARHFLEVFSRRFDRPGMSLGASALAALRAHRWPGNVRELEHAVERAVVLCPGDVIAPEHLGLGEAVLREASSMEAPAVALPLGLTLEEASRRYVQATLGALGGNRSQAARSLGIGRNTLRRRG
ncbi:MAG: sigma-54-dependent Fis family transcriptional regulator [Deltaproteobacteria bacterium]|nr:sigma-54-dependent Fis family transcriptional regulator [Deltaproteobacteria bacterium]